MSTKSLPPYFTQPELLNELVKSLGLTLSNKQLRYDYLDRDHDHQLRSLVLDDIINQLSDDFDPKLFAAITDSINQFFDTYLECVKRIALDSLTRAQSSVLLSEMVFSFFSADLFLRINKQLPSYSPMNFIGIDPSINIAFSWFETNVSGWPDFWKSLDDKERKDRIRTWRSGKELPLYVSIKELSNFDTKGYVAENDWRQIKSLLIISRSVDYFRKKSEKWLQPTREFLWSGNPSYDIGFALSTANNLSSKQLENLIIPSLKLHESLSRSSDKSDKDPKVILKQIETYQTLQDQYDSEGICDYWLNWFKARWHIFNGKIEQAVSFYKLAFESSIYRAGGNQLDIIEESLVSAAMCDDRTFLKQLKEQAIVFGLYEPIYDQHSDQSLNKLSRNKSAIIQDWEVSNLKSGFYSTFPKHAFFKGCEIHTPESKIPPITGAILVDESQEIKPDYRAPNRKIKPDMDKQKIYPQLVWFTMNTKYEIVEKLLAKGARVDICTDSGESALLVAIQELNPQVIPFSTLDSRYFELISSKTHNNETLNIITSKRRLSPLHCAIETGRIDVVKKILEMGANPNQKAELDDFSPLYHCINLIHLVKKLQQGVSLPELKNKHSDTSKVAEALRRYGNGLNGLNTKQNKDAMTMSVDNLRHRQIIESVDEIIAERNCDAYSLSKLRDIALLLINEGADINQLHSYPINGFTPLMLATEVDESMIFSTMLDHGGNANHKIWLEGEELNVLDIAKNASSMSVIDVIRQRHLM